MVRSNSAGASVPAFSLRAWLVIAFTGLQLADVLTTDAILRHGGQEVSPLEIWAQAHLYPWWLLKVGVVLLVGLSTRYTAKVWPYAFITAWYLGVVGLNLTQI